MGPLSTKIFISFKAEDEALVEKLHEDLNKLRKSYAVKATSTQLSKDLERILLVNGFSNESRYASNLSWFINSLSEEYRAHFLDQRNAMLEAGEADHVIRHKLFQYWFMAVIWTPIVSKLQRLIPPTCISS